MKYSAFAEAAAEATAGLKEIDAEINRLMAQRDLLETLVHQLSSVLPADTRAIPADTGSRAGTLPDNPAEEHLSYANGVSEDRSYSNQQEEWPTHSGDGTAPETDAPAAEQASYTDLVAQSKPYSLRNEGWPATSPVDQRGLRRLL
jgi:hypothetical protein